MCESKTCYQCSLKVLGLGSVWFNGMHAFKLELSITHLVGKVFKRNGQCNGYIRLMDHSIVTSHIVE
jgi:hypothetical protein